MISLYEVGSILQNGTIAILALSFILNSFLTNFFAVSLAYTINSSFFVILRYIEFEQSITNTTSLLF